MKIILIHIKELLQIRTDNEKYISGKNMAVLPTIKNAFLVIEGECILNFGKMQDCPEYSDFEVIDCTRKIVLPSWCDSHSHLVFAGNREQEFVDRINGLSYEEIANRGGGILNSAKKLQETSEDELYEQSKVRLQEVMHLGTGAIEIKSGYGLTLESELKMLRVMQRLAANYPIEIKKTFLCAHAVPNEYNENKEGYIDLICDVMLPAVAKEKLADFVDVFCEKGYFSLDQMEQILKKAAEYNLKPKVHVNQFNAFGAIGLAVKNKALSVDHLEVLNPEDLEALKNSETMPVALPSCSFFLGIPYTPARELMANGLPIALASDFNPGSSPSGNMNFVVATACIKMKMTPEEAINAATLNGAYAMGLEKTHGSIAFGKIANLIITKPIESYYQIPYLFGSNLIETIILRGKIIQQLLD
jgi:imidazolonepropionase